MLVLISLAAIAVCIILCITFFKTHMHIKLYVLQAGSSRTSHVLYIERATSRHRGACDHGTDTSKKWRQFTTAGIDR